MILSIGVRPNSELARAADLAVSDRGFVKTDEVMRTSDPTFTRWRHRRNRRAGVRRPRAGAVGRTRQQQGRIAANHIAGVADHYAGSQSTSVAKVYDLTVAATGANEKTLIGRGMEKGKDYQSVIINQNSHAGYYPGAVPLVLKLLFSMDGKRLFGAQIVGRSGVDKRIDTIAVALRMGAGVEDLMRLELAYAPPYSSAKDPVNMAGFTARNVLDGLVTFCGWDAVEKNPDAVLLDVREDAELLAFTLPGAVHIPLGQLRDRLGELDPAGRSSPSAPSACAPITLPAS